MPILLLDNFGGRTDKKNTRHTHALEQKCFFPRPNYPVRIENYHRECFFLQYVLRVSANGPRILQFYLFDNRYDVIGELSSETLVEK